MKTRNGFVSNSSSSSFVIVGRWLKEEDMIDDIYDVAEFNELEVYESEDGHCIGVEFDMKNTETWGHYKEKIADKITKMGIPTKASDIRICSGEYAC